MTTERIAQATMEFGPERTPEEAAEIRAGLRRYTADRIRLAERHEELLAQHPEEWVAMCEGVLFSSPDLHDLIDVMRAGSMDPALAAVRFVTGTPLVLVLRS